MLLLNKVSAVGVSESRRVGHKGITDHTVDIKLNSQGAALISACVVVLQGSLTNEDNVNGLITNPTLVTGTTAERVANSAFAYIIAGTSYTKGAVAAGTQFTIGAMLDGLASTPAIGEGEAPIFHPISGGLDVIQTVGSANITAGEIDYYGFWRPLSDDGLVVAA